MPASTEISKKNELASKLRGLMPSRVADSIVQNLMSAKISRQSKRIMLYDIKNEKDREHILFPLESLKAAGVDVPKMGKDTVFVTTGLDNGQLINKNGETFSFRFRGNGIRCSVNGGQDIELKLNRGNMVAKYV